MRSAATLALAVFGVALSAAPSLAVTRYVRAGGSIQTAVNAAANGDTIVCGPGIYHENVVVSARANIKLVANDATIEAADTTAAAVRVVDSSGCRVTGFTVHGGAGGCVRATRCSDVRIRGNRVSSSSTGSGVVAEACTSAQISANRCTDVGGDAVSVTSCPAVVVRDNVVRRCGATGIMVSSDAGAQGAVVATNRVTDCMADGIDISGGTGGRCAGNVVGSCGHDGVSVSADAEVVVRNRVRTCGHDCVSIVGDTCTVTHNTLSGAGDAGVHLEGSGNSCSRNSITGATGAAVSVGGSANVLAGNVASACGQLVDLGADASATVLVRGGVRLRIL